MFKKSRRKIVAAILSVLIMLLVGTFLIIYISSYVEMTGENQQMLRQYVSEYNLSAGTDAAPDREVPRDKFGGRPEAPPILELSTFYSVAVAKSGQVLKVDTADISTINEEDLIEMAEEILAGEKAEGTIGSLIFRAEDKGEYYLVAFLDNTVFWDNAGTLLSYTLLFGGIALAGLFFLARYLADRIVSPLEESYQKQKQFVSDAGHELKTPVAVVNANIEELSRQIGENKWLANIRYENERMSALISQLLDLARAENAASTAETIDLSRLVYGETLPFETVAFENGLTLKSDIEEDIAVSGNSLQLKQLTSILLDNAIRHSDENEIELTLKREKNCAVLSVFNSGKEIPPEQKQLLFERFYRSDEARTGECGHYGLGLAIAKAIVTSHKGTIDVRCGGGKIEFYAKIPLQTKSHTQNKNTAKK